MHKVSVLWIKTELETFPLVLTKENKIPTSKKHQEAQNMSKQSGVCRRLPRGRSNSPRFPCRSCEVITPAGSAVCRSSLHWCPSDGTWQMTKCCLYFPGIFLCFSTSSSGLALPRDEKPLLNDCSTQVLFFLLYMYFQVDEPTYILWEEVFGLGNKLLMAVLKTHLSNWSGHTPEMFNSTVTLEKLLHTFRFDF